jgi:hypothetical protein
MKSALNLTNNFNFASVCNAFDVYLKNVCGPNDDEMYITTLIATALLIYPIYSAWRLGIKYEFFFFFNFFAIANILYSALQNYNDVDLERKLPCILCLVMISDIYYIFLTLYSFFTSEAYKFGIFCIIGMFIIKCIQYTYDIERFRM